MGEKKHVMDRQLRKVGGTILYGSSTRVGSYPAWEEDMDDVDYDEDFEEADEEAAMADDGGTRWLLATRKAMGFEQQNMRFRDQNHG